MRRGAKPAKAKGESKRPVPRKSGKGEGSRVGDLEKRLAEALKDKAEALEQQTATADILRVISRSPSDIQPVFDAIVQNAVKLCEGLFGTVLRLDGDRLHLAAHHNLSSAGLQAYREHYPVVVNLRETVASGAILDRRVVQVIDSNDPGVPPRSVAMARATGFRSVVVVPMLRDGEPIGVINVARQERGPFAERQVALLQTFADQAVIAIENVRLFKELGAKNGALTDAHTQMSEALEQQTATSEILRVISRSPTDLQPVFDMIVGNAARVCEAFDAVVVLADGEEFVQRAHHGPIAAVLGARYPLRGTVNGRAILEARVIHVENLAEASDYSVGRALAQRVGYRTMLSVPLLRDGAAIGAIGIRRTEVLPFSDEQIAVLKTFADQAVIAIENVRLFTELQEKNRDLMEALAQQTATSEILRVISSSPSDARPVFETIVGNAGRLCGAESAVVYRFEGGAAHFTAHYNLGPEAVEAYGRRFPRPLQQTDYLWRIADGSVLNSPDIEQDSRMSIPVRADYRSRGARSAVWVPMVREGQALGAISVTHRDIDAFSHERVQLLQTFADQAVIAIENVRLFKELGAKNGALTDAHTQMSEALEQQTATSEILRVISSSPTDLRPVMNAVAENAARLCDAADAHIWHRDGDRLRIVASHGAMPLTRRELTISRQSVVGRAVSDRRAVHVEDLAGTFQEEFPDSRGMKELGYRTILAIPLLREEQPIGVIMLRRTEVRAFSGGQVALLKTFADQAVIAIENVRLFTELADSNREIAEKSHQLEVASQHKSEFLANMSHELRTPLNAVIGFSEVLLQRMFGELNAKQDEYLQDIYASGQHLLSLINDILDLSKIEAGRMELELTDFDLPTALDSALTLIRERAGRRGIALHLSVDERLGQMRADERKIRQVVLNVLSNAIKFTPEGGRIEVAAVPRGEFVEVSVSDTGIGVAPEDQEAVFEEFRQVGTAAKKVEGTGLGLALSRKFIELHGGRIWVQSQVGIGSTFTFTIPVQRADQVIE
jgi:two-component system, NtrC family, sensor kinase